MSFYTRLLRDQRVYQLGHTAQRILCDILMRGPIVLISRNGFLEAVLEYTTPCLIPTYSSTHKPAGTRCVL